MPKALTWVGLAISALLVLLFGLDLATGTPFKGASTLFDITVIVCCLVLAYMSWNTLRELR
jgi:hypothetical protein